MSLLKTGACFTAELELNCPTIVACVAALPVGPSAVAGDLVLGPDNMYHALPAAPVPNGSETKVVAGTNTTVTGSGTTASPYVVSAAAAAVPDGSETKVTGGANVTITGAGTVASPYVVAAVAGATPDGSETKVVAGANTTVTGAGTTASPYVVNAAAVPFATPAQTIVGTSTTLAVNPADLYARENIPAQTGLSNNVAAIPAPTAGQSPWGVNALGETLHYAPGLGWKIVSDQYTQEIIAANVAVVANTWTATANFPAPRAGLVVVTYTAQIESTNYTAQSGSIFVNGVLKAYDNNNQTGPTGVVVNSTPETHGYRATNSAVSWTGRVAAGDLIQGMGISINFDGTVIDGKFAISYIG
jgi:hypothetical protein